MPEIGFDGGRSGYDWSAFNKAMAERAKEEIRQRGVDLAKPGADRTEVTVVDLNRRPFLYLAGPIMLGDRVEHFSVATKTFAALIHKGIYCYIPQWHMLTTYLIFTEEEHSEHWLEHDFQVIRRCDGLIRLHGESAGADREVELAYSLGLPVFRQGGPGWSWLTRSLDEVVHFYKGWKHEVPHLRQGV